MRYICYIILVLFTHDLNGQIYFEKLFAIGVSGEALARSAGNTYLAGGQFDGYITKIDGNNNAQWGTKISSPSNELKINDILISNGYLYIIGQTLDTIDPNPAANFQRNFIAQLDTSSGTLLNSLIFGDSLDANLLKIDTTIDGNLMAVGYCNWNRTTLGTISGLIVKIDHQLNIINSIELQASNQIVLTDFIAFDNYYYITGSITESDYSENEFILAKVDTSGGVQWIKYFPEPYSSSASNIISLNNKFFISGSASSSSSGYYGIFSAFLDSTGNLNWLKFHSTNFPLSTVKSTTINSDVLISSGRFLCLTDSLGNTFNYKDLHRYVTDINLENNELITITNGDLCLLKMDSTFIACYTTIPPVNSITVTSIDSLTGFVVIPYSYFNSGFISSTAFPTIDSLRCEIHTGVNSEPNYKNQILLSPNPAQNYIKLKYLNMNMSFSSELKIFNSELKLEMSIPVTNLELQNNEIMIDITQLKPGLYSIFDLNLNYLSKFIKI